MKEISAILNVSETNEFWSKKGRGCADGRPQCKYMSKEDKSSPTVAVESLMLSCTIYAEEQRDVATTDMPLACRQI